MCKVKRVNSKDVKIDKILEKQFSIVVFGFKLTARLVNGELL